MLTVVPSHHHERIDVLPGGPNEFTFDVPEACLVKVRVIDDGTSSPVPASTLGWHMPFPSQVIGYGGVGVEFKDGVAELQAPVGEILLNPLVSHEFITVPGQTWLVRPGRNEFTVHVTRACGLRVLTLLDGEPKGVLGFGALSIRAIDHSGKQSRQGMGASFWCQVTKPGRYKVSIKQPRGYESIPDRTVNISRGKMVEVRADLVPDGS